MRFARSSKAALIVGCLVLAGCFRPEPIMVAAPPPPPELPALPPELVRCFVGTTRLPADAEWSAEQVTQVIARLRQSEIKRTRCGRLMIRFYEDLARSFRRGSA